MLNRTVLVLMAAFSTWVPCVLAEDTEAAPEVAVEVEATPADHPPLEEVVEEASTADLPESLPGTSDPEGVEVEHTASGTDEPPADPPTAVEDGTEGTPPAPTPQALEEGAIHSDAAPVHIDAPVEPQELTDEAAQEGVIVGFPILPPPGEALEPEPESIVFDFLPAPPEPSVGGALLFALAALLARVIAWWAVLVRGRLASTGVLPVISSVLEVGGRAFAFLLGVWAALHLVPRALAPLVSVAMVGAAFAVGWSLRGYATDAVCGIGLIFGRDLRRDQQVGVGDLSGRVLRVGLFSTAIWSNDGRVVRIPNREISGGVVSSSDRSNPHTELTVRLSVSDSSQRQHALLRDCVLLSPYLDASAEPEIWQDAEHAEVWHIRVVLGASEWAQPFREACRRAVRTEDFVG